MNVFKCHAQQEFGVSEEVFQRALEKSPGSRGGILGAISELLLSEDLESRGFEVLRIKEKPKGSNTAKSVDARGDFYIRPAGATGDCWYVVECKGLKSNSEFRGDKLSTKAQLFRYLSNIIATGKDKARVYKEGYQRYKSVGNIWNKANRGKKFPPFSWDKAYPGPNSVDLSSVWQSERDLKEWVLAQPDESLTENSYRNIDGPIAILETHQPSIRKALYTGVTKSAPLVSDFSIMAVDLFYRTKQHEFVFMNPKRISHSPTSPEHLYQNYTIDILVKGLKENVVINPPWYPTIQDCIKNTTPDCQPIDITQLDRRGGSADEAEEE